MSFIISKRLQNTLIGLTASSRIKSIQLPGRNYPSLNPARIKDTQIPYADFKIDEPPIFRDELVKQISFEDIIKESYTKPVKRRSDDSFTFDGVCPYCGAPKEYIYDNSRGRGQYKCKACKNTFTLKTTVKEDVGIYCPYCKHKLTLHHDRNGYLVYVCQNHDCSYYKHNKKIRTVMIVIHFSLPASSIVFDITIVISSST